MNDEKNEKLNIGINEIKKIKMTSLEKDVILHNILNSKTQEERPVRSPWAIFSLTSTYSPYLRFAVYLIIILSGGGFILNSQKSEAPVITPNKINIYKTENTNLNTIEENKKINKNTTENTNTVPQKQEIIIPKESVSKTTNQVGLTTSSNYKSAVLNPTIIYKTKKDYSNNVSVGYTNGEITSYPGPSDAVNQKPIKLANGYLLKKMQGNVFLNITIDEFIKHEGDWFDFIKIENIIDFHPFTEIYNCPSGISEEEINKIILSNNLKNDCEDISNNY
jgi:hypothetical protein